MIISFSMWTVSVRLRRSLIRSVFPCWWMNLIIFSSVFIFSFGFCDRLLSPYFRTMVLAESVSIASTYTWWTCWTLRKEPWKSLWSLGALCVIASMTLADTINAFWREESGLKFSNIYDTGETGIVEYSLSWILSVAFLIFASTLQRERSYCTPHIGDGM